MKNVSKRKMFGQGMTEYIIIVALIAVAAIGVYAFFGKSIRNQVAGLSKEVAGVEATAEIAKAGTAATDAAAVADKQKTLANYNNKQEAAAAATK
jgi:Flp pilus assembly pilin Flp